MEKVATNGTYEVESIGTSSNITENFFSPQRMCVIDDLVWWFCSPIAMKLMVSGHEIVLDVLSWILDKEVNCFVLKFWPPIHIHRFRVAIHMINKVRTLRSFNWMKLCRFSRTLLKWRADCLTCFQPCLNMCSTDHNSQEVLYRNGTKFTI